MIHDLLKFVEFTNSFQKIERVVLVKDSDRWENDAEHSYQLSVVALYLINKHKLPFNIERVLLMTVIHDLVEVYAGDTYIYGDSAHKETKEQREKEAAEKIKEEFPDFTSFHEILGEYERRETEESKFIYALDKMLPGLNIFLDGGRTWRKVNVDLNMQIEAKMKKISTHPLVFEYYQDFLKVLKENEHIFPVLKKH